MSYILDALKKSDQDRKQGEIPTLESVHTDLTSTRVRRSTNRRNRFLLICCACLAVIAVGLWQWRSPLFTSPPAEKTASTEQGAEVRGTPPPAPPTGGPNVARRPAAPAPTQGVEIAAPAQETAPPQSQEPVQVKSPTPPATTPQRVVMPPAERIEPASPPRVVQPSPPPPSESPAAPDDSPPLLKDLPPEIRRSIPEISMAGHVYSEVPARRMIMINNKIVREGERVGDQLKLLRITWDGVILRHMNTDFQIKL
ncbi:general secretion pathway protein GspB [Desulfoprunum benzoelyticum]|uniref:general secretion pathway protein GspB n=1 Tax=Desulfoprunum benzoelyticum TaxID=1506996 RepID=UPI0019667C85|nr:general secretion pathway protein GspB [Desulfoprunum benzoelyticum]MBM9530682.1 general secretion pathway protein GspB [Desulfoprunum benzoelyticum]